MGSHEGFLFLQEEEEVPKVLFINRGKVRGQGTMQELLVSLESPFAFCRGRSLIKSLVSLGQRFFP